MRSEQEGNQTMGNDFALPAKVYSMSHYREKHTCVQWIVHTCTFFVKVGPEVLWRQKKFRYLQQFSVFFCLALS